jgi:cephalosporin hydroxylase
MSDLGKLIKIARTISNTSLSTYRVSRSAAKSGANQKWSELSGLVHLLTQIKPKTIMEIGLDHGGTMALWARLMPPDAKMIGVDLKLQTDTENNIRTRMKTGQSLRIFEADSHTQETRSRVVEALAGTKLDFLFIDGDHSYEGVKRDFEDYSTLVRTGGLVAFHDIVPDSYARFGIRVETFDAGGVWKFWREVSSDFPRYEFIENIGQNGYGIGVLRF